MAFFDSQRIPVRKGNDLHHGIANSDRTIEQEAWRTMLQRDATVATTIEGSSTRADSLDDIASTASATKPEDDNVDISKFYGAQQEEKERDGLYGQARQAPPGPHEDANPTSVYQSAPGGGPGGYLN